VFIFAIGLLATWSAHGQTQPQSPRAVADLVTQLADPAPDKQAEALAQLRNQPPAALAEMMSILDAPGTAPQVHDALSAHFDELQRALSKTARARQEEQVYQWDLTVSVTAYEKFGSKDKRWDALVLQGLRQMQTAPADRNTPRAGSPAKARQLLDQAYNAGCRDAVALEYYALAMGLAAGADRVQVSRMSLDAIQAFEHSNYPASCRFNACFNAYKAILGCPDSDALALKQMHTACIELWPAMLQSSGLPAEIAMAYAVTLEEHATNLQLGRAESLAQILPPYQKTFGKHFGPKFFEGAVHMDMAFDARGGGLASEVSQAAWHQMDEELTRARKLLEEAWRMDPTSFLPPSAMITVELGQPHGRKEMELWFRRAMNANPDNMLACQQKIQYLQPHWHGSKEDLLAFAHEALTNSQWGGHIPLIVLDIHAAIANDADASGDYYTSPDVWNDIHRALDLVLKHYPNDLRIHTLYLVQAVQAEQWQVAQREAKAIGDHPDLSVVGSVAKYQYYLQKIAQQRATPQGRPQ
jgi:hypothetical protein